MTVQPVSLRFCYLGNLGLAHDIPLLCEFLRNCRKRCLVNVTFIGTGEGSLATLREFAGRENVNIESRGHVDFAHLRSVLQPVAFDFGIVTFAEEFLGLLSPSKFAGYLEAQLPIIYLGPPDTNVALICEEFGAGVRLDRSTLISVQGNVALEDVFGRRSKVEWAEGVARAASHFRRFNGDYLAAEIMRRVVSSSTT